MSAQSSSYEPNLTPILDMVFQLITFFMLVINFKASSMDMTLKLPVLGSARPLEYEGDHEPITLNLLGDGTARAYGEEVDTDEFIRTEAQLLKAHFRSTERSEETDSIPVPVVIRADETVPFERVMSVMKRCQTEGLSNVALSAMSRQEAR